MLSTASVNKSQFMDNHSVAAGGALSTVSNMSRSQGGTRLIKKLPRVASPVKMKYADVQSNHSVSVASPANIMASSTSYPVDRERNSVKAVKQNGSMT